MKLELKRRDGSEIKYQSEKWVDESNKRAVFLPGFGYSIEAPLFHYMNHYLLESGWNVLSIDYRYNLNNDFLSLSDEEKDEYFKNDCLLLQKELEKKLDSGETLFIAKSLGTSVLYNMLSQSDKLRGNQNSSFVWLTPAGLNKEICSLLSDYALNSLYIQGDADSFYDENLVKELKGKNAAEILIIPAAGHSFEEKHNIRKTMENTTQVISFIIDSISKYESKPEYG
jgi:predicted alpha/beta hydrolase